MTRTAEQIYLNKKEGRKEGRTMEQLIRDTLVDDFKVKEITYL